MKIALVKRRFSLRHGGSERYCVNLSRQLQQVGHDVTIIGETIDEELQNEVLFVPVRPNRLTSWTSNRSFAEQCGKAAKQGKYDITYGIGRSFGLDAVRVTERLQSHWVCVHYRHPVKQMLQRLNPRHRTLIDLERTIYQSKNVRRIVTQSQLDRKLVCEYYNIPQEKIQIIYNGVDTTLFNPGLKLERNKLRDELNICQDVPLIIFASMDFEGKGLRSILNAIKKTKHSETHLLVLGTGPEIKFKGIAKELGIGRRIVFAGRRNDIQRCYGAGDLFLLPTAYEPFPNVNLEAMACGLPVVTTLTAGGADIIQEKKNGYLISNVNAVDEMTCSIDNFFSLSDAQRTEMSATCWEVAQKMTLQKNVQQTVTLFQEVLDEKNRC